jgi:hypothetical protein
MREGTSAVSLNTLFRAFALIYISVLTPAPRCVRMNEREVADPRATDHEYCNTSHHITWHGIDVHFRRGAAMLPANNE